MNVATLTIEGDLFDESSFEFTANGSSMRSSMTQPDAKLRERIFEGTASGPEVAGLLPQDLLRAIRQAYYFDSAASTLAIISLSTALDVIPWERVPHSIGLPELSIVRVLSDQRQESVNSDGDTALLVAGWSGSPTLKMPGIQTELTALGDLAAHERISFKVLAEPTIPELVAAWRAERPRCVHIAAPALVYGASGAEIAISGTKDLELVSLDGVLEQLGDLRAYLVLINTCDGGFGGAQRSAARVVAERLKTTTISWYGAVHDLGASDFARFFYSRLLEGNTALDGIRAFNWIRSPSAPPEGRLAGLPAASSDTRPVPTIWIPSIDALDTRPLAIREAFKSSEPEATPGGRRQRRTVIDPTSGWISTNLLSPDVPLAGQPQLVVEFEPQRWLNPALLKNQYPAIVRLTLTAEEPIRGVGVSITCDAGVGLSTVAFAQDLARGPQPLDVEHSQFPVLYQLIDRSASRRWVNFTVRCTYDGAVLAETTHSVLWMALSEWLDRADMWHFIPAFVDPNAKGVLDVLDEANVLLRRTDPTKSFDGYQSGDPDCVKQQVATIFNCLRGEPFQLNYINVPPLDPYIPGESMSSGQRVRTPTEVIDHRRGTCNDLAILFASCLEHIGINPLVVLKPGHTYVGFWLSIGAWERFWKQAQQNTIRLHQVSGHNWIINSAKEFGDLVTNSDVLLLEATRVTDRNATFADALARGRENLLPNGGFDVAVDVVAARREIQPL